MSAPGVRLYDEDSVPINTTNPLPVSISEDSLTITVEIGSLVDTNYSNIQKIENATDYTLSITLANPNTDEERVSEIIYSSVIASLTTTETYTYGGNTATGFYVKSIART